jgi:hypothetical protein
MRSRTSHLRPRPRLVAPLALLLLVALSAAPGQAWELRVSPYFSHFNRLEQLPSGPVLAGTHGGVFVSHDDGASWTFTSVGSLDDPNAGDTVAFDTVELDDGTVYLLAENVFRLDADLTGSSLMTHWPASLETAVASGDTIWAATREEIHRSLDRGETWTEVYLVPSSDEELTGLQRDPVDGTLVTEVTRGGGLFLEHSSDGGTTWNRQQITGVYGELTSLAIAPDGVLWFTHNYLGDGFLRTTTDLGASSQLVYAAPSNRQLAHLTLGPAGRIAMQQNNFVVVSTDGGQSFDQADTPFVRPEPLRYTQSGRLLAGLSDGLQWSDDDGQVWNETTTGLWANDMIDAALAPDGTAWILSSGRIWHDAEDAWTRLEMPAGTGQQTHVLRATSSGRILLLGQDGDVPEGYYTDDRGTTWHAMSGFTGTSWQRFAGVTEHGGELLAGHRDLGLFVSSDDGETWTLRSDAPRGAIAVTGDGTFWATSDQSLDVSSDQGATWQAVDAVVVTGPGAASPVTGAFLVPGWSSLHRSTDAGQTWENVYLALSNAVQDAGYWVTRIAGLAYTTTGDLVLAVETMDLTDGREFTRIMRSSDDGDSYTDVTGSSLIAQAVLDHVARSAAGPLIACTNQGLYVADDDGGEVAVDHVPATATTLGRNHPNPFNPRTVIPFSLARAGHVELSVLDLRGRRVATLVDRPLAAGTHAVPFDGGRLGSGVYLYRLEIAGQVTQGKMTLLK